MNSYRITLFLHIITVILGMGVTFAYPFLQAAAERQGPAATRYVLRGILRVETLVVYPGAVLVFLFGLALIFDDTTGYSDDFPGWLMIAIPWYLVAMAVEAIFQRRNLRDALATLEGVDASAPLPEEYVPIGKRIQMVGGLVGISIIGIAFLMVWGGTGGF